MKKTLYILLIVGMVLVFLSCSRTEVADPSWDGPAGFNVLLEGSVTPALQLIDGRIHYSEVYVRVTDAKGNPLANKTVFLEQLVGQCSQTQINWGYFKENMLSTIQQVTNANGEIKVTFGWPTQYYSEEMWIHALLVIDGRAYKYDNVPEDWISLTMYRAGGAAMGTTK
jgi:hypothetical protein